MSALEEPLDLHALRARYEAEVRKDPHAVNPLVSALLAEVERLRLESVPRSALVRVGISHSSLGGRIDVGPEREACYWNCRPGCKRSDVFVLREGTDEA